MPSSRDTTPISEGTPLLYGQQGFTKFVSDIELHEIASRPERELYGKNASAIADPARRRETKIKQYQAEKEIRGRIEVCAQPSLSVSSRTQWDRLPECRPSRNGSAFPSQRPTPPQQTLTSSQRCYRIPRPQPQMKRIRTSTGPRRSSYSDLPTHRRTHNSRASQRNSSSCAWHPRPHRPANPDPLQIAHAFPLRLSAHHGPSMHHCAPQRQCGVADRCWTRQAKYFIRFDVPIFARFSLI